MGRNGDGSVREQRSAPKETLGLSKNRPQRKQNRPQREQDRPQCVINSHYR